MKIPSRFTLRASDFVEGAGLGLVLSMLGSPCAAQFPIPSGPIPSTNRPPVYSTHDWTVTGLADSLKEAWADAKSPGDGRTYKVGTIEIRDNRDISLPTFSGARIFREPSSLPQLFVPSTTARFQVVAIQITNDSDQSIATVQSPSGPRDAQVYFYGFTQDTSFASNARAISVWPAANPAEARIAICGEVYDRAIPASQAPAGWAASNPNTSSGFIAVYDGNLQLLWTHHLFGAAAEGSCAVTDVSVRREGLAPEGTAIDVVTYCGITSHGHPGAGTPLTPLRAFAAPSAFTSSGTTSQAAAGQQWDGFVGRTHRSTGPTPTDFHSIVSGPGKDGLFGLAEMDEHRFAVVGASLRSAAGGLAFPFTFEDGTSAQPLPPVPHEVGTLLVFDSQQTRTGTAPNDILRLESSQRIGAATTSARTTCRDVAVGFQAFENNGSPLHALYLCGSTTDTALATSSGFAGPSTTRPHGDPTFGYDGFVVCAMDVVGGVQPWTWCYSGIEGVDAYTGLNLWNEFPDHFTVAGYGTVTTKDILAESYLLDTAPGFPTLGTPTSEVRSVRRIVVSGSNEERPAVMGFVNATAGTPAWISSPTGDDLGDPAGGGVAVAPNGRTNVVGWTSSTDFPALGGGRGPDVASGGAARVPDALRVVFDLVPLHVGRTDGVGDPIPGGLPSGFTGGTTPSCALSPFGIRIGGVAAGLQYPVLRRMLVDYEGDDAFGLASVFVCRPPAEYPNNSLGAVLQLGLPNTTPPVLLPAEAVELWTTHSSAVLILGLGAGLPHRAMRVVIGAVPVGVDLTAQVLVLMRAPLAVPSGCVSTGALVGTPAIWIDN